MKATIALALIAPSLVVLQADVISKVDDEPDFRGIKRVMIRGPQLDPFFQD